MRVVGGRWRGRPIAGPEDATRAIRPTSDRLRESIFNILAHGHGDPVPGARVLDLFAGTGAMGIEALSRGAAHVTFVDDGSAARGLVRRNVEALGAGGTTRLLRHDATRLGSAAPYPPAGLVFCDPPYRRGLAERALAACLAGGWLAAGALVVTEEASDAAFTLPDAIAQVERRIYGDTQVTFGRYEAP